MYLFEDKFVVKVGGYYIIFKVGQKLLKWFGNYMRRESYE